MPKISDFSKSFIYKFVCNDISVTEIYVGASCDFIKRKACHKSKCNNEKGRDYNIYVYKFMRDNGGFSNWTMLKIVDFPCNNRFERDTEERRFIELLHAGLNKIIPTRTLQQYMDTHKETISDHKKEYYNTHKETISDHKKEYYQTNKETVKESCKQYRDSHKEIIKEKANEKCVCRCGGKFTNTNTSNHNKSLKHQNHINTQPAIDI